MTFERRGPVVYCWSPHGRTVERFGNVQRACAHYGRCIKDFERRHPGVECERKAETVSYWRAGA